MLPFKLIVYFLCAFGISEMFVFFDGPFNVIRSIRDNLTRCSVMLGELFGCMFCFSTWVGALLSTLNYFFVPVMFTPFNILFEEYHKWWLIIPLDMFITCGMVWMLYQLEEMIERIGKDKEYEE